MQGLIASKLLYLDLQVSRAMLTFDTDVREIPLSRDSNGGIEPSSQETLKNEVQDFLRSHLQQSPTGTICALPGRGLLVRTVFVPKAIEKNAIHNVLALQIETTLPLPPEELAWGWLELPQDAANQCPPDKKPVTLFALKRQTFATYEAALATAPGPVWFTLAASCVGAEWTSNPARPRTIRSLLLAQARLSELWTLYGTAPLSLQSFSTHLSGLTSGADSDATSSHERSTELLQSCVNALGPTQINQDLLISLPFDKSESRNGSSVPTSIDVQGTRAQILPPPRKGGTSASLQGLRFLAEQNQLHSLPWFSKAPPASLGTTSWKSLGWRWPAIAAGLAFAIFLVRYGGAYIGRSSASKSVQSIKSYSAHLPAIDKELAFLSHLDRSQGGFLDALYVIGTATTRGTKLESLSMNRRGDLSLRLSISPPDQAQTFRKTLLDTGYFTNIVLEEITQSPDRQKATLRLTAKQLPKSIRPNLDPKPSTSNTVSTAKVPGRVP